MAERKSKFRGVYWHAGNEKWKTMYDHGKVKYHIQYHAKEDDAARHYDQLATAFGTETNFGPVADQDHNAVKNHWVPIFAERKAAAAVRAEARAANNQQPGPSVQPRAVRPKRKAAEDAMAKIQGADESEDEMPAWGEDEYEEQAPQGPLQWTSKGRRTGGKKVAAAEAQLQQVHGMPAFGQGYEDDEGAEDVDEGNDVDEADDDGDKDEAEAADMEDEMIEGADEAEEIAGAAEAEGAGGINEEAAEEESGVFQTDAERQEAIYIADIMNDFSQAHS